jgi:hypothetical protein
MAVRWSFALSLAVSVVQGYVQYPTFSFVNSQRCLDRDSLIFRSKFQLYANFPNYSLRYPDNTVHPVSLPYPLWASGRITGEIAFILISEVMQYWAHMFNTATDYSAQVVNYASGCLDPDDPNCVLRDTTRPKIHFTIESWQYGIARAAVLPTDVRPTLLSVHDYDLSDGFYLWQEQLNAGLNAKTFHALDDYRFYNASHYTPHIFFDTWQQMLALLPESSIIRCAQMASGMYNDRYADLYVKYTNNTDIDCFENDTIWFSPACLKSNKTMCVPLMIQYSEQFAMQLSFFLNIAFAVVMVGPGAKNDYADYYKAIRSGRFLFGYYSPDDTLVDANGKSPIILGFPPTNALEHAIGLYRTGLSSVKPRNFCWPSLASVDSHIEYFAGQFNLYNQDMAMLMNTSRALQNLGSSEDDAARMAACEWIKTHQDRWVAWIPAVCPAGAYVADTVQSCIPCPAGRYCPGRAAPAALCPIGSFCPANASRPAPCPAGTLSPQAGASSEAGCSVCASGYIHVAGACASYVVIFPSAILPAVAVVVAALLLAHHARVGVEARVVQRAVADLRRRLGVTRGEGFLLSSEWRAPWQRIRPCVVLQVRLRATIVAPSESRGRRAYHVST